MTREEIKELVGRLDKVAAEAHRLTMPGVGGLYIEAAAAIRELLAIADAAWDVRTEMGDYNPCPDLAMRARRRDHLHKLLDEWKGGEG